MRGSGKIFVLILIIVILAPNEISVFAWSIVSPTRELNIAQAGNNLDLFTQKGGIGPLAPSDAFAPEELLILYSNVTYNDSPVPHQWVTFEICNAAGNISADMGNYTDALGIATTSFRLPSSGFPPAEDPNVFGIWTVTSAAEWGGNVSSDSLIFKCGWLVKLVSVEPGTYVNGEWYSKRIFHMLEALEVMVTLTSICFSSQNIYLSVDYFDAQGYPFFDNGLWYNKTGGTTEKVVVCLDRIPTSTRVGTATLQAVVTSRPVGGVALCPSVSNLTVISSLQWWNHSWNRRVRVEICDNSGSSQKMLPVEVTFKHGGNSLPDGSDIRVVAENSQIPCKVISINGTHATVGFAIDLSALEARTIFIYYGNPSLSSSGISSASSKDPEGSTAESNEPTIVIIPDTIVVSGDFPNLQQAINHANVADTVFARKGTYYGTVLLNNSVVLVGESVTQTILDGGRSGNVTEVTKNSVTVADLTIRNSGNQAPSSGIVLDKVENCAISSVNIIGCYCGISLFNSGGNDLDANNITSSTKGIYLFGSSGCNVSDNVFANNGVAIFSDASSNNSEVYENYLTHNTLAIEIASSSDNTVSENTITQNSDGVKIVGADANNNTLRRNDIANNSQYGVSLFSSQGNTITENNIGLSEYGVWLNGANNNTFFYNNFTGNPTQVFVEVQSSGNIWDNGYPSGGNYWSNYAGADLFSGPHQNETGSDGIGDTPYVIDATNQDNYPLTRPFVPFDNQTIYIKADGSVDPSGAPVQRKGDLYTLTDNITSSSDGIVIERDNIVLDGAGFTVQGDGTGNGIDLPNRNNVTNKNTNIENFEYGAYLENSSNNIISGNNVTNNDKGIWLYYSSHNSVSGNNVANNSYGIYLVSSSNNNIVSGNNITANDWYDIVLDSSSNNRFYHNNFVDSTQQVYNNNSTNTWDDGYPSGGNYWSDYAGADLFSGPHQNETGSDGIGDTLCVIDASNRDNYPLMHAWVAFENQTIYIRADGSIDPSGASMLRKGDLYNLTSNITSSSDGIVIERDNVTLDGAGFTLQGTSSGVGIFLSSRSDVAVVNTSIRGFESGIALKSCCGNTVSGNIVTDNVNYGIHLYAASSFNIISGNTATNSIWCGIFLEHSSNNNTVTGNKPTNNPYGIHLWYSSGDSIMGNNATANYDGIYLEYSSDNRISQNSFSNNNNTGIFLDFSSDNTVSENDVANNALVGIGLWSSTGNTISGNSVTNTTEYFDSVGLYLVSSSSSNKFYHNNIINNTLQLVFYQGNPTNLWDDGYPGGGNYWSNCAGADLYSGVYQNLTGSDGIGDISYAIDANNTDNYPLMNPWTSPDIAVTNLTSVKTVIGQGDSGSVNVTCENLGSKIEAFNVTVYANSTIIHSEQIMLAMTNYTTRFKWNTTGFAYGNYTLSAYAKPVPDETYTTNNNCTYRRIKVSIPDDLNGDFKVSLSDLSILAKAYSTKPGDAKWNPNADVNDDGIVNLADLSIMAKHFNQHYP